MTTTTAVRRPSRRFASGTPADPTLRPGEAAAALGVSVAQLRRYESDGRLVTIKTIGGHRRYLEADVLAVGRWRAARQASGASAA